MGMRVHKLIGYGFQGLTEAQKTKIRTRMEEDWNLGKFADWCKSPSNRKAIEGIIDAGEPSGRSRHMMWPFTLRALKRSKHKNETLYRKCVLEEEFGVKDLVVFVPLEEYETWHRYDDIIDWAEECYRALPEEGPGPRVDWLDRGLSPFNKGKPPLSVAALVLWAGVPEVWPLLRECLYVYWS